MTSNPFDQLNERFDQLESKLHYLMQGGEAALEKKSKILDINEAAKFIKKSKYTVYTLCSRGRMPYFKRGNKLYFDENQLINWIKTGE
jgi:predicted DNA-binding transcriptional regulator AlpA